MTIGIPQRGLQHSYIYELLQRIAQNAETEMAKTQETLLQIRALLEPLRAVLSRSSALLEKHRVLNKVSELFDKFDSLFLEPSSRIAVEDSVLFPKPDDLRHISRDLMRYLADDIPPGRPCIRDILSEEYLHFLPDTVRSTIQSLAKESSAIRTEQFDVRHLTSEGFSTTEAGLPSPSLVLISQLSLVTLLRDLLSDVRHVVPPNRLEDDGKISNKMLISFGVTNVDGSERYLLRLENWATMEGAERAKFSSSWSIAQTLVEEAGGVTHHDFDARTNTMSRLLCFRFLKKQAKGEKNGDKRESLDL